MTDRHYRNNENPVTWTEPPEPSGRWFTDEAWEKRQAVCFMDSDERHWTVELDDWPWTAEDAQREASAALVDLIESDHLPPQMPAVHVVHAWLAQNGYGVTEATSQRDRTVIRGTLDAIAALDAHGRTGT